jgi:hypothetical protein
MPLIYEAVLITLNADNSAHIAPMGFREEGGQVVIAPFRPSRTLENIERTGTVTVNLTDDVRVIAGCLTGRREWPVVATSAIAGFRLADCLAHRELRVERIEEDELRPCFFCTEQHVANHAPFRGFNRAQAAVVEAAILATRLKMLPHEKICNEIKYLQISIDKTAGERERQAWDWIMEKIESFYHSTEAGKLGP